MFFPFLFFSYLVKTQEGVGCIGCIALQGLPTQALKDVWESEYGCDWSVSMQIAKMCVKAQIYCDVGKNVWEKHGDRQFHKPGQSQPT